MGGMLSSELAALLGREVSRLVAYQPPPLPEGAARLYANECSVAPSPEERAAVARAMETVSLARYPDARAASLRRRLGEILAVDPEGILFGNGLDEVIFLLTLALSCPRPGMERARVVHFDPTFVMYRHDALCVGAEPIGVPVNTRGQAEPEQLAEVIAEARPNLVFITTPNNPTGALFPLEAADALAARFEDTVFAIDEAYIDYAREGIWPTPDEALALARQRPNVLVLRTFSKVGFAALRCGFAVGNAALLTEVDKVRPPFNLPATTLAAAEALLEEEIRQKIAARVSVVRTERDRLAEELRRRGFSPLDSKANFLYLPLEEKELAPRLLEEGVAVRYIPAPAPLGGGVRVTVGTPQENERLLSALENLSR